MSEHAKGTERSLGTGRAPAKVGQRPGAGDHFGRLLARHGQGNATETAQRQVRPRLPGPFERVEAVRGQAPVAQQGQPWSSAPPPDVHTPAPAEPLPARAEEEVALPAHPAPRPPGPREGYEPPERAQPLEPARADEARLRPASETTPRRPAAAPGQPEPRQHRSKQGRLSPPRAHHPSEHGVLPAPLVPPRTDAGEPVGVREAVRAAAARRAARPAEPTVHVRIGRLEVTAAPPPGRGRTSRSGGERPGRPEPAVSLEDYLTRGGTRNGETRN